MGEWAVLHGARGLVSGNVRLDLEMGNGFWETQTDMECVVGT